MCEICSNLTTNTPERLRRSGASIFNFKQISRNVLVFPLSTLNKSMTTGIAPLDVQDNVFKLTHFSPVLHYI